MRSTTSFPKSVIALVIVQATFSGAVLAETTQDTLILDELKVEGRAITELDQAVSSEDIENSQASSLEDLFRNKSEITAGGGNTTSQKIYVRNIGEDSLNITIDGAEQANALFHHAGRISLEPELLKRVEVEAGAANATSGPGALGGSVRFITKDPSDLLEDDQNIGALLKSTYSSNGEGLKNSATVYGRTESGKFEGMVHLTDSSHSNFEDGEGNELDGTEQDANVGFLKIKSHLTDEQTLSLSHENIQQEGEMLYRPEWFASYKNYLTDSVFARETTTLNYQFTDKDNDLIDTKLTVYQTNNEQERYYYGSLVSGSIDSTGINARNTSLISDHEIVFGFNHRDDSSSLLETDGSTVDATGSVTGLYIQDTIAISDQLTLSMGARYDQYEMTDEYEDSFSAGGFAPNIGLTYQLNENFDITTNYAEAIRGPELRDAYTLNSYLTDDSLELERSQNIEIGANYHTDKFEVGFGVYQSVINDPYGINYYNSTTYESTYGNKKDPIETVGFYLDATYQMEKLTAGLHFHSAESLADGDFVTRYEYGSTANNIGDTLALSLDYEFNDKFQAGWSAEIVQGIYDIDVYVDIYDNNVEIDKPSYTVHNLYAKWLPLNDDSLTLALSVTNLFNEQYISHAAIADYTDNAGYAIVSGQAAAGRDIRLSAAYKF